MVNMFTTVSYLQTKDNTKVEDGRCPKCGKSMGTEKFDGVGAPIKFLQCFNGCNHRVYLIGPFQEDKTKEIEILQDILSFRYPNEVDKNDDDYKRLMALFTKISENMFRLVGEHPNVPGTDTIKVNITQQYKWHERTIVSDRSLAVAMIVETESFISEDPFVINDSTASQSTVLKTLHENNKGVFYMGKTGKGYQAKKSRIFLTPEEVEMMRKYHTEAKARLENKIIVE